MRIATLRASAAVYDAMMSMASPDVAAMLDPIRRGMRFGRIRESY